MNEPTSPLPNPTTPVEASPIPEKKIKSMNFGDAMKEVALGKKISKIEWKDINYYGVLDGEILKLHKPDGNLHSWIISLGDLDGDDYILI